MQDGGLVHPEDGDAKISFPRHQGRDGRNLRRGETTHLVRALSEEDPTYLLLKNILEYMNSSETQPSRQKGLLHIVQKSHALRQRTTNVSET